MRAGTVMHARDGAERMNHRHTKNTGAACAPRATGAEYDLVESGTPFDLPCAKLKLRFGEGRQAHARFFVLQG